MSTAPKLTVSLLLLFSVFHISLLAQERATESVVSPTVTASVYAERVRFTAAPDTTAVRLSVYTADGQRLFDSGFKPGTLLDWALLDERGQRYPAGTYLCVVAVKSLNGTESRKLGTLSVQADGAASLEPTETAQLSGAQLQALGGAENSRALTVLREGEAATMTSVANTGTEGEIARERGALSFRLGDLYRGKDREQMRLTEEGNLGIGTDDPQARLDVNGVIRARQGIEFNDGTLLSYSQKGGLRVTLPSGKTESVNVMSASSVGTGTAGQLARWTDNNGTLGNSAITELSGNIGIGNTSPQSLLHIGPFEGYGSTTGLLMGNYLKGTQFDRSLQVAPVQTVSPGTNSILLYTVPTVLGGVNVPNQYGLYVDGKQGAGTVGSSAAIATGQRPSLGATNNTHLLMGTGTIPNGNYSIFDQTSFNSFFSGSMGIGTPTPSARLEVAGNVKISGNGNGIIFPDGSLMTTAGGGGTPSGTSIISAINDPATMGTIGDARLSANVARLNSANTFTGDQTVNGNLSASAISLNGSQAVPGWISGGGLQVNYANMNGLNAGFGTLMVDKTTHRVGINQAVPQYDLDVRGSLGAGSVATSAVSFPDGSVQHTAAATSRMYTTSPTGADVEIGPRNSNGGPTLTPVLQLNLPSGIYNNSITYEVNAVVQFENTANQIFQNNSRLVTCTIGTQSWSFRLAAPGNPIDQLPITLQTMVPLTTYSGTPQIIPVTLSCGASDGGTDRSFVFAKTRRLTATQLEKLITQ